MPELAQSTIASKLKIEEKIDSEKRKVEDSEQQKINLLAQIEQARQQVAALDLEQKDSQENQQQLEAELKAVERQLTKEEKQELKQFEKDLADWKMLGLEMNSALLAYVEKSREFVDKADVMAARSKKLTGKLIVTGYAQPELGKSIEKLLCYVPSKNSGGSLQSYAQGRREI